jgi:hypothetical protein
MGVFWDAWDASFPLRLAGKTVFCGAITLKVKLQTSVPSVPNPFCKDPSQASQEYIFQYYHSNYLPKREDVTEWEFKILSTVPGERKREKEDVAQNLKWKRSVPSVPNVPNPFLQRSVPNVLNPFLHEISSDHFWFSR